MEKVKFKKIFSFEKKSKIKAGDGFKLGEGKYPFFTSSDTLSKTLDEFLFEDESLIFGTGGLASIHHCNEKFAVSTDCFVTQPIDIKSVHAKYVYFYLSGNMYLLENGFKGAGLKHISKRYIEDLEIPIPNLPIQQKIAAILDKADELRQYNKQLIAKYDALTQSLFLEMFGDPVRNEKDWKIKSIDSLCKEIVDCVNRTAPLSDVETEYIMIRTTNIKNLKLVFNETRYVTKAVFEKWTRRLLPKKGDIVFTREAPTGEVGIIDIDKKVFLGQRTMLFRPNLELVNNYFLMHQLAGYDVKQQISKLSSGSTVKHLSVPACKKFNIKVPPIKLQNQFAERVQLIENQKQQAQEALEKSEDLFQSLLQRAFKGELN